MTWFWQHQNDRHPFHPLFWFVQSNLENLFAEKVWYRPKLTFILSFADDMLMICWWYADWLVMSRVYEPRPRKFVSKGAKPRYPKLHRGVEIVGPGNDSNGNGKCSTSCCTASSQPYLDWNPFFNWSRRSWLKPLSPQCSHVLPHVRCLSHCHPAKRPGENESPLQAQLWSCVGYNVYNIFVPCITHIANMLRICWIIFL